MEKIQSIQKSKTIDYSDKPLERFWLECNTDSLQQTEDCRTFFTETLNKSSDSVICMQTEKIDDPELIKALYAASKNNRIYILTNDKPSALKDLSGCCLVRSGVNNIGSFMLINPGKQNSSGYLFTAPFLASSFASDNIILTLDINQTKTLFRFFCNAFWNKASHEIIDNFDSGMPVSEPPLDFLPNLNDFCDEIYVKKECTAPTADAIVMLPELRSEQLIDYRTVTDSKILIHFGYVDEQALTEIINGNNELYATKNISTQLLLKETGKSFLIPKPYISKTDNIFALELNDTQKNILMNKIRSGIDKPEYHYLHSEKRGRYAGRTIHFTSTPEKAIQIRTHSDIELSTVYSSKFFERDLFEQQEPQFQDDGVSCSIAYTWEIKPFCLPNGAKKARLYDEWEDIEQQYKKLCETLKQDIDDAGKRNITERLKRFFLGKNQKFMQYKNKLDELKTKQLSSLEKSDRKELVKSINEIRQNISSDKRDIDNEIEKAKIDDAITDLENKKAERETVLSELQEKRKIELQEKEAEINALKQKLAEKEEEMENVNNQSVEEGLDEQEEEQVKD